VKPLQLLVAALLLVTSSIALAGKPIKEQEINSGPVWQGNLIGCWVSNSSDVSITADITIYYYDPITKSTEFELFEALSIGPNSVIHRSRVGSNRGGYCKINWVGNIGELRGTFCGFYVDETDQSHFLGCSDAY